MVALDFSVCEGADIFIGNRHSSFTMELASLRLEVNPLSINIDYKGHALCPVPATCGWYCIDGVKAGRETRELVLPVIDQED